MKMYEDGLFLDQASISNIGDITNGADLMFGTDIDLGYDYEGSIAEVRIWDEVLTDQEILDYFCDTIDATHPSFSNLIGYWKMNEGSGTQVIDETSNGNNGTITDAIWYTPDSIWMYDYANTPRIVDASINALGHLCIPIDPAWELDGKAWLVDCEFGNINCVNPGYNSWIGPANGMWNLDSNWSKMYTPIICDNVIIPTGNIVTIENGELMECHSIKVESGSELMIDLGGQLNVQEE